MPICSWPFKPSQLLPGGRQGDDDWYTAMTDAPGPAGDSQPTPPSGSYGNPGGTPYGGNAVPRPMRPEDERLWATLIHIGGIPFGFLASLIGYVIGGVLTIIVIGSVIIFAVGVVIIIFSIIAAVAANRGQYYRYPLSIEFIH